MASKNKARKTATVFPSPAGFSLAEEQSRRVREAEDLPAMEHAQPYVQPYVVGFLFDLTGTQVLLRKKQKPDWMLNKFNGVGGKLEPRESWEEAMRREFDRETGLWIPDWQLFCRLTGKGFEVACYAAYSDEVHSARCVGDDDHQAGEAIESNHVFDLNNLPEALLPNCRWLIPMALSLTRGEKCLRFQVQAVAS